MDFNPWMPITFHCRGLSSLGILGDGQGVDVYIVDTGVYTDHVDLVGRAEFGLFF